MAPPSARSPDLDPHQPLCRGLYALRIPTDAELVAMQRRGTLPSDEALAAEEQQTNIARGGDGCCHKTRLLHSPCPIGWRCPFITPS